MTTREIKSIVHKNYLMAQLAYKIRPYPSVVSLDANSNDELVVMFQKNSGVKSTIGPAKWLDKNGVAHAWKVEGHPEFKPLVRARIYLIIGNVMHPDYAWNKNSSWYRNSPLDYIERQWLEFKFRAYLYDTIANKFNYGISFKRQKSLTSNELFIDAHESNLHKDQFTIKCECEIVRQFKRVALPLQFCKGLDAIELTKPKAFDIITAVNQLTTKEHNNGKASIWIRYHELEHRS